MAHIEGAHANSTVEEFLGALLEENEIGDLTVYITGGVHEDDIEPAIRAHTREDRRCVLKAVQEKLPGVKLRVNWGRPNATVELILDTETGKFRVEE